MNNNLISIIVPIYNSVSYLEKCIDSLLKQTYRNIEIILIDDGSTDGSSLICDTFLEKDDRVKVIHQENSGVSSARNKGIEIAQGEFIYFMDSDDYIENDTIEYLYSSFSQDKQIDIAICNYYINDIPVSITMEEYSILNSLETAKIVAGTKYKFGGYLWNKMFKKEIISKNNLTFNINYHICEDALFCQEYITLIRKSIFLPLPKYHYFKHPDSAMRQKVNEKKMTVLSSYQEIIRVCEAYCDSVLTCKLVCNFVRHNILILRSLLNSQDLSVSHYQTLAYNNIKKYFLLYVRNKETLFKHKLLGMIVIIRYYIKIKILNKY